MYKKRNELLERMKIINLILVFAFVIFLVSIFSNLYIASGFINTGKDDLGNILGAELIEKINVYNIIFNLKTTETGYNYFSWELLVLYIIVFISFFFNFINVKKYEKIKHLILTIIFSLAGIFLIILIIKYFREIDEVFKELADISGFGSFMNTKVAALPIVATVFIIISGILNLLKYNVIKELSGQITLKKGRK